jgi:hypothetical protein
MAPENAKAFSPFCRLIKSTTKLLLFFLKKKG